MSWEKDCLKAMMVESLLRQLCSSLLTEAEGNWRLQLKQALPQDACLKAVGTPSSDPKSKEGSNYQDMPGLTALIFLMRAYLPQAAGTATRKDGEEIKRLSFAVQAAAYIWANVNDGGGAPKICK